MAVVGSETLAIMRKPGANLLILGDREDDIAIEVVAVHGEGQLVYESLKDIEIPRKHFSLSSTRQD